MTGRKICANCVLYQTQKCSHAEDFRKYVDGIPLMTKDDKACGDFIPFTKKKETQEQKTLYTPGFFILENKFVFEQLADHKFATNIDDDLKDNITIEEQDYFPCLNLPWEERLIEEPSTYGTVAELQKEVRSFIFDHCYLTDQKLYDVLAAWVFQTWIPEVFDVVPYLYIHGPKNTGKTRLSDVLCELSFRGLTTPDTSEAGLFVIMENLKPTLFIDENSSLNQEVKAALNDVLNSGYKRGSMVIRCNDKHELFYYRVFGPKSINGTKPISETLESRCIPVKTINNKNLRKVRNTIDRKRATEIRSQLLTWRFNYLTTWSGERGECCERCEPFLGARDGRIQELFTPLLTVANDGKDAVLSYIESMANERTQEEKASLEADFVEIFVNLSKDDLVLTEDKEKVVLTKTLQAKINADKADQDRFKAQTVGSIVKRLGFSKRHTRDGNGWLYDEVLVKDLEGVYHSVPAPKKPSQGSQGSQEPLLEVCKFCGKPITESVHDWIGSNLDEPAHVECAEKWRELKEKEVKE
jgi:hypothetical protein